MNFFDVGLMICCDDEHLKANAFKYLNEFIKIIVHIAISYFSGILCDYSLEVNPYVLIETITIVLSNEKETVSKIGALAIDLVMKELHIILGNNVIIDYLYILMCFIFQYKNKCYHCFRWFIFLLLNTCLENFVNFVMI